MKLLMEKGYEGRALSLLGPCDVPTVQPSQTRTAPPRLPQLSETELSRH